MTSWSVASWKVLQPQGIRLVPRGDPSDDALSPPRYPPGPAASPSVSQKLSSVRIPASEWMPATDVSHEPSGSPWRSCRMHRNAKCAGPFGSGGWKWGSQVRAVSLHSKLVYCSTNVLAHKPSESVTSCQLDLFACTTTEMQRDEMRESRKNAGASAEPAAVAETRGVVQIDRLRLGSAIGADRPRRSTKVSKAALVCYVAFLCARERKVGRRLSGWITEC